MKYILSIVFLVSTLSIYSQIGVKTMYNRANNSTVNDVFNTHYNISESVFQNNFGLGINYKIQIKGMELLPTVGYETSVKNDLGISMNRIHFGLPFIIYPMNMEGDCGCPDFSLRNKFFQKHLFLVLNTAVLYETKNFERTDDIVETSISLSNLYFKIGLGAGILLPITESFSIAPTFLYNRSFKDKWKKDFFDGWQDRIFEYDFESYYTDFAFELRFNYRFNN